jgi:hypothetical protein
MEPLAASERLVQPPDNRLPEQSRQAGTPPQSIDRE